MTRPQQRPADGGAPKRAPQGSSLRSEPDPVLAGRGRLARLRRAQDSNEVSTVARKTHLLTLLGLALGCHPSACELPFTKVVVVGDSFTSCHYDYSVPRDEWGPCWADLLETRTGCRVANLASTGMGASDWAEALPPSDIHCKGPGPCLGIVWLGDQGEWSIANRKGLDAANFEMDVAFLAYRLRLVGADEVILVRPPTDTSMPATFAYRAELSERLQQICDDNAGIGCLDLRHMPHDLFPPNRWFDEGVHPTPAGQEWIADQVLAHLEGM